MSEINQQAVFNDVKNYCKNSVVKIEVMKTPSNSGVLTLVSTNFNFKNNATTGGCTENKTQKLRNHASDVRAMLRSTQITKVRASMENELPGNNKVCLNFPRRVSVSVHRDVTNPYVIILESDRKYARPLTCLRLAMCNVSIDGDRDFTLSTSLQAYKFVFRTSSTKSREKWVNLLTCSEQIKREFPFADSLSALIEDDVTSESEIDSDVKLSPASSPSRRRKSFKSFSKKLHSYEQNRPRWMTAS